MHFAAGYQLPRERDAELLAAFEAFLPTYPWNDTVVRKSDVQAAFEKSEHSQPVSRSTVWLTPVPHSSQAHEDGWD